VKKLQIVLFILLILVADQALKYYIKTNYRLGEEHKMIGNWFRLHFVENAGMAWGWKLGGDWGKIALSVFRMVAVIFGIWYINKIINEKYKTGFIICVALIFAGAFGNLIDSMFYGIFFERSNEDGSNVARFLSGGGGYAGFLQGHVVDMLYFPLIRSTYPTWFPWVGGEPFEFFSPVFNIADASISIGLIIILLFQKRLLRQRDIDKKHPVVETTSTVNDQVQIS
jgi:signal peptidase II